MFQVCLQADEAGPWPIFDRLLASHEELATLRDLIDLDVTIAFMMRADEWRQGGRTILGQCSMPSVQGTLAPLFRWLLEEVIGYSPDFLVILSADWWEDATPAQREVLVFHEVLHAGHARDRFGELRFNQVTGSPILCINPHDLEEFNAVVRRYGAWSPDVAEFLRAAGADPETSPLRRAPAQTVVEPVEPAAPVTEPLPPMVSLRLVDDEF